MELIDRNTSNRAGALGYRYTSGRRDGTNPVEDVLEQLLGQEQRAR